MKIDRLTIEELITASIKAYLEKHHPEVVKKAASASSQPIGDKIKDASSSTVAKGDGRSRIAKAVGSLVADSRLEREPVTKLGEADAAVQIVQDKLTVGLTAGNLRHEVPNAASHRLDAVQAAQAAANVTGIRPKRDPTPAEIRSAGGMSPKARISDAEGVHAVMRANRNLQ